MQAFVGENQNASAAGPPSKPEDYHRVNTFFISLDKVLAEIENRFSGNDQDVICRLGDVILSDSPATDSSDLVAGYYNLDKKLLQGDQRLFNRFKKTHVEKSIKTAAKDIDVLHEDSHYEITPDSKVASILAVIPAISGLAERSLSGLRRLKTYLRTLSSVLSVPIKVDCSPSLSIIYSRERKSERSECEAPGGGGGVCERSEQEE